MRNRTLKIFSGVALALSLIVLAGCASAPEATEPAATTEASAAESDIATPTDAAGMADATDDTAATEAAAATAEGVTCTPINLNDMAQDDLLATIPGFSDRMVREFFEYQPYVSIQQFRQEIGKYVDDSVIEGYEAYVYVPVNINESDAETLMQIPGVDAAAADTLMAARPFESVQAFTDQLAALAGADAAAAAACYVDAAS